MILLSRICRAKSDSITVFHADFTYLIPAIAASIATGVGPRWHLAMIRSLVLPMSCTPQLVYG